MVTTRQSAVSASILCMWVTAYKPKQNLIRHKQNSIACQPLKYGTCLKMLDESEKRQKYPKKSMPKTVNNK